MWEGQRGRGGQGSWHQGCGWAPAGPREGCAGRLWATLAWEDASLLLEAVEMLHGFWTQSSPPPPVECSPSPPPASRFFYIRLSGVLMPYEFRTKESEAHGLSPLGGVVLEMRLKGRNQSRRGSARMWT